MSMQVNIDLHHADDLDAFAVFAKAMAVAQRERDKNSEKDTYGLAGLVGGISREPGPWKTATEAGVAHTADEEKAWQEAGATASDGLISSTETINKPTRVPGQPSPGAKRRTKAEIAEDDAAAVANVASIKADVLAGAAEQQKVYDSPEDQAQDAADEAAEAEAAKTGLTHDDLRQAVGRYQKKFGMAAAVAGVPALLGCALIDVPETDLAAAIAKVDAAVAGEARSDDQEKVAAAATKEAVMAAMLRYAEKFDGQSKDMNAMPKTMEDAPRIFTLLFGKDVVKLSQVPADGYAKTVAAFDEAITKNPFKR